MLKPRQAQTRIWRGFFKKTKKTGETYANGCSLDFERTVFAPEHCTCIQLLCRSHGAAARHKAVFVTDACGNLSSRGAGVSSARLCGFAGDTLLIFSDKNRRFFFLGAAAFAAGHVLYLAALFDLVSLRHNALLLLLLFLVFLAEPTFLFFRLRREIGGVLMRAVGGVYAAVIAAMAACSAYTLLLSPGIASTLRFCGMLSFLVSDSLLVFCTFRQNGEKPWQAGVVMSSYIAAQTLLCMGFSL